MELLFAVAVFGLIVYLLIKEKRYKKNPMLFKSILFLFIAVTLSLLIYLLVPNGEKYILFLIGVSIGGLIVSVSYNNISSVFKCSEKINGIYRGYNTYYGGQGASRRSVMFEYKFNGIRHREQSTQGASHKELEKMSVGEEYAIYVNPNEPWKFVINKSVRFVDVMIFLFGLLCILIGFYGLML